ncbi:MAG: ATP-dependent DNA helicase, partial [Asticcacaulis sp.]|nr:ATP-dependent DNA helicase [Asticcacaulis sp.]
MSDPVTLSRPQDPWWRVHTPKDALGFSAVRPCVFDGVDSRHVATPELRALWGQAPLIVANAPLIRNRLFAGRNYREAGHFDVLELFAFVRPAQFCAPSAAGVAIACGFPEPVDAAAQASALIAVIETLTAELEAAPLGFRLVAQSGIKLMERNGWAWAPLLQAVLDRTQMPTDYVPPPALEIWSLLEEWEDQPPEGQARAVALSDEEVTTALDADLKRAGLSERRPEQREFALKARDIFAPKWMKDQPNMLLAEAGT